MKKPTGSGTVRWDVKEAREIQAMIDARGGLRNLEDHSGDDDDDIGNLDADFEVEAEDIHFISSDHDDDVNEEPDHTKNVIPKTEDKPDLLRSVQTVRATDSKARRGANALGGTANLVKTITDAFDPNAQLLRNRNRNQQNVLSLQLVTQMQQLRDATVTIETLRRETATLQDRLNESKRRCDLANMRLEMLQMQQAMQARQKIHRPRSRRISRKTHKHERVYRYPDGGEVRYYLASDEEDPYDRHWLPRDDTPPRQDSTPALSQYSLTPVRANDGQRIHDSSLGDSAPAI